MGNVMVASFSVAAPEGKAHWEFMAWLYALGLKVSFILAIIFAVVLFRTRTKKANK